MARALGVTTVLVLTAIERGTRYGLDIGQRTELQPGTVYTTLRRLERRGHVNGSWEDPEIAEAERRPRRRYYRLTPEGRAALEGARRHFESLGVELPSDLSVAGGPE